MSTNTHATATSSRARPEESRSTSTRTFAHHYGEVKRADSAERALRVYPPLSWGVLRHVRRSLRRSEERIDELHLTRAPLAL